MRFFVLVSACLLSFVHPSLDAAKPRRPTLKSIHIIDNNGFTETVSNPDRIKKYSNVNFLSPQPYQKVLRIFSRDNKGNVPAYITSYYPNSQPKQYLEVVNNRAQGWYYEWHPNGQKKLEAYILGGSADITPGIENSWLFDGCSRVWDEHGRLTAEIPYSKGLLEGDSTYFHPNGKIAKKVSFRGHKREGTAQMFRENGEPFATISYSNDLPDGLAQSFWTVDQIAAEEEFHQGYLAAGRYYDQHGKLLCKTQDGEGERALFDEKELLEIQEIHEGEARGEIKVFTAGEVTTRYHVKKGQKHGKETIYYPRKPFQKNALPQLELTWYEGMIQGTVRTWYENGVLESQKEMTSNDKNGLSTAWYQDGSVMMIEEYDRNKLQKGSYFKRGESRPVSEVKNGNGIATLYDSDGNFMNKVVYQHGWPEED